MKRTFAFEEFSWYDKSYLATEKEKAEAAVIRDKEHTIVGSDIDPTMIAIAKDNAKNA